MLLPVLFVAGYLAIAFEHRLRLNKSASALLTGVACWVALGSTEELGTHLGEISQILFFLLGAMTIVELIDAHDGFDLLTCRITTTNRRHLLLAISVLAFFLSAVLDNLTTSIVMMSLVRRLCCDPRDRMMFGGAVIIAANAGGAWSPIGDVTTTMLWIGGQITAPAIVKQVFVPALVSVAVPMAWLAAKMHGHVVRPENNRQRTRPTLHHERFVVLILGVVVLVGVPVFKYFTQLPPYMGMLLGLGVLWTVTELLHKSKNDEDKGTLSVAGALQRIDTPSILFFLGILLAVAALHSGGLLAQLAHWLEGSVANVDLITLVIGLASAVVDNVPLVAAAQGMYPLSHFPVDHHFWLFLAYCAGTGGSILIIGSAAGIAVMGMERISFGWYVRHIGPPALLGYLAGALAYLALAAL